MIYLRYPLGWRNDSLVCLLSIARRWYIVMERPAHAHTHFILTKYISIYLIILVQQYTNFLPDCYARPSQVYPRRLLPRTQAHPTADRHP